MYKVRLTYPDPNFFFDNMERHFVCNRIGEKGLYHVVENTVNLVTVGLGPFRPADISNIINWLK